MQARFFTQAAQIEAMFPRLQPMFARVAAVDDAQDALKQRALAGKLMLGAVEQNGQLMAAIAFERVFYPRLRVVNIVAFAGSGLDAVMRAFFSAFQQWCRQTGIDAIEARCGEGMARWLRRYGFKKVTNVIRMTLER